MAYLLYQPIVKLEDAQRAGEQSFYSGQIVSHTEAIAKSRSEYTPVLAQEWFVAGWDRAKWGWAQRLRRINGG